MIQEGSRKNRIPYYRDSKLLPKGDQREGQTHNETRTLAGKRLKQFRESFFVVCQYEEPRGATLCE